MALFTEQELRARAGMRRLEVELEKAIQRRNVDRDRNGHPITLPNGNAPTPEEVRAVLDRTMHKDFGLVEKERHLKNTMMRKRKNPGAGVAEVRKYEMQDSHAVTWDDVIWDLQKSIEDSRQYMADVKLAGEWYGYWLEVNKGREASIAGKVAAGKAQSWDRDGELDGRGTEWENPVTPPYSTENLGERFYDGAPSYLQAGARRVAMNLRSVKVGDRVEVVARREYGVTTHNSAGGTASWPVGQPVVVTVKRRWFDYETGEHAAAETDDGRPVFFGEFWNAVRKVPAGRIGAMAERVAEWGARQNEEMEKLVRRFGDFGTGSTVLVNNPNYNRWRPDPSEPEVVEAVITDFDEKHGSAIVGLERTDGGPASWNYVDQIRKVVKAVRRKA